MNKDVDYATHGFAVASEKTFLNTGFRILRPPVYSGPALVFNYTTHPEFSDVRVRQAIAYVIDRNENGTVALGDSGKACKFMVGFLRHRRTGLDLRRRPEEAAGLREGRGQGDRRCCRRPAGRSPATSGDAGRQAGGVRHQVPDRVRRLEPGRHQRGRPAEQVRVQHHQARHHLHPAEPGRPGRQVRHGDPGLGRVVAPAPVLRVRPEPLHVQLRDRGELRRQGDELPAQADDVARVRSTSRPWSTSPPRA